MVNFICVVSVCVNSADHKIVPARNSVYYFRRVVKYFPPALKAFPVRPVYSRFGHDLSGRI
ncbi:hypothetical protein PISMIDRAFT_673943 [Pisolithus microcarpus 441]|uniref:Uncharacterized protein n=1 Tax=Pisolithus microcarpus 441 TaxID=765257 RepID=A0A0C9YTG3_9AGAM|nr:hypothetical protein PISMIDRAFT_673943 [Pisolithus microcarpus 441]